MACIGVSCDELLSRTISSKIKRYDSCDKLLSRLTFQKCFSSQYYFFPSYLEVSSLPTRKLFLFSPGSIVPTYWEASSPPIGKLYHFPPGSFLTFEVNSDRLYWESSTKNSFFFEKKSKKFDFSKISR